MLILNFLKYQNLDIENHSKLDFVDINIDNDTKLYIDPSLIDGSSEQWCKEASNLINGFFDSVFECYRNNDEDRLMQLLDCSHEPNETKLGMSSGKPKGKGTSSKGLYKIFKDIYSRKLFNYDLIINPMDLCIFVHDFAEDRMSDLVTNILRKKLAEFTVKQCLKLNIEMSDEPINIGKSWNNKLQEWEEVKSRVVLVHNKPVLLVPKNVVRRRFIYSAGEYLSKKVIEHRQEYHKENNTSLAKLNYSKARGEYIDAPSKKIIMKEEISGIKWKDFNAEYTIKNPKLIVEFREEMMRRIRIGEYSITDEELDNILYTAS